MSSVVLERVNKVFPRPPGQSVHALRDFSIQVAEREFLVLLGPSGSGKTTALRLISGLDEPTSGSITIGGVAMNRVPPKERDVAMVFQHHALYPHKTVRENLEFGLKLRRVPRAEIESRVREMAAMLELATVLDVFPAQLSGGQRQRVALGRALIRRPKVLLCDEPLSQLDAPLRAQLRAELLRLRERLAVTVIYVTHDQAEAMTLGDRIAVLHEGRLQQVGPPLTVYCEPANLFVAGFVGTPPMNLLRGVLLASNGEVRFQGRIEGDAGGLSLLLDPSHASRPLPKDGQPVVLGVRPEHVRSDASGSDAPGLCGATAVVRLVERTGADAWLHCETGPHRIIARASASVAVRVGEQIWLLFKLTEAHYFDAVTQQALG